MWRRLMTLILVLIFLASSVAALGPWGMAIGAYLLTVLSVTWLWPAGWNREAKAVVDLALAVPIVVVFFFLPYVSRAREAGGRVWCANHLKQVALALLNYHHNLKCFPPACLCDASGKPMHSWRVLILPLFCMPGLERMGYNLNEPWNSPQNRLLEPVGTEFYTCPTAERAGANQPPMTSYVLVTGPGTALSEREPRGVGEATQRPSDTVLLVEVANSDIHWMEPRDFRLEDLFNLQPGACRPLTSHHVESDYWFEAEPASGFIVCVDASVHFLRGPISPEDARALLTANDGKGFDIEKFANEMPLVGRPRWDHIIGLPVFFLSLVGLLVLALTPCPSLKGRGDFGATPRREERPADEPLTPW